MKVLITGGAGFIGSNLSKHFLDSNQFETVRVVDDLSTGSRKNLTGLDVEFIEGSILDKSILTHAMEEIDSVVHLGAIPSVPRSIAHPVRSHDANSTGTLMVLEAARAQEVEQVIVASSSSVYGSNPKLPKHEDDWTRPMSPYAVSKLATEGYALAYQAAYGLKTLAFRFFNVYGPGQAADHDYAAVIPKFIDAALTGRSAQIYGDGTQSRDFTYVDTVCQVITEAVLNKRYSNAPMNLAFNTNTTLLELLDEIENILGQKVERQHREPRRGDVKASQADSTSVSQMFPNVRPTKLSDGLTETISWFKKELVTRKGLENG
ncbi:SDR family oxidoreductase [Yaniella flava]|uniref:SDR family oxidoreductase n=1 Tax=Yaniella flava TaxID=287930 RepID=A0ABP5GBQ0_9MICC